MKYYTYDQYDPEGGFVVTRSEHQILQEHWEVWYTAMRRLHGDLNVNPNLHQQCIADWVARHMAWEVEVDPDPTNLSYEGDPYQ